MKKSVLLVEYDEPTIANVREILASPVYDITVANDGEAAKKVLATRSFDLVITAAMLPRFHGFNLSLHVAEEFPATRIIVISAIYKGNEYRHQATSQYRADDFFEKPLPGARFSERVRELLGVSEEDLHFAPGTTTTEAPVFDTAKIPSLKKIEEEEKKFTSEDLFG
ncbi:MAG TPA: response regulator, partial [Candidatus Aminicenantes bacterium]|nr:response regulator [Candidatus Aminicenantes bacterium]